MAQVDNFFNRIMPKLPPPKNAEEQKARDLSNQQAIQRLQKNPRGATYLGLTGVGNNREFTNPVAPIAKAYNDAGGGLAGVGGVLGAAGKTVTNDASQLASTLAQPFLDANQRVTDQMATTYNASKSALPVASQAVADVAKGVSSGYSGTPVNERTNMEVAWSDVDGKNAQRLTPAVPGTAPPNQAGATPPVPANSGADVNGELSYLGDSAARKDLQARSFVAQDAGPLISQGYRSLNNPETNDPVSGKSPGYDENILVKERFGTPKEYTAAVQSNQNATRAGQIVGLPQSHGALGYAPNDATKAGMEYGGAITEYAIPGKGTATFMGQRQGGGTFSVGSTRTPEEQAAIDQSVKSIESQTAAMRGLRNANRQDQGLPTVEREEQLADMQRMMPSAPSNSGGEYFQQAQKIMSSLPYGNPGDKVKRQAMQDQAETLMKMGGANMDQDRNAYNQRMAFVQNAANTQASQQSAAAKAQQDQAQWLADYGLKQEANTIAGAKNEVDANNTGQQRAIERKRLSLEERKAQQTLAPINDKYMSNFYEKGLDGKSVFSPEKLAQLENITTETPGQRAKYTPYLDSKTNMPYMYDESGNLVPISLQEAILRRRAIQSVPNAQ